MPLNFIDIFIVFVFMALTFVLGLRVGIRTKSLREYAIADKAYSAPILFMTLTATIVGAAGTIGTVANVYQYGIVFAIANLSYIISFFFVSKFIVPKFDERFDEMLSAGDILAKFYGSAVERFSASIVCAFSIAILTAQMIALAHVMYLITGIEYIRSLLIFGIIIISYSGLGGIKAVVRTDVLQFLMMVIALPALAFFAVNQSGGFYKMVNTVVNLDASKFQIFGNSAFNQHLTIFILYLFPMCLGPNLIQRFLMSNNKVTIRRIMYGYVFIYPCILACCALIAFAAIALIKSGSPKEIIPYMILSYLPVGIKGIVLVGIIATIMSTADSYLNTAGVFFNQNLLPKRFQNIAITRLSTILIGMIALSIAIFDGNIIYLLLFAMVLLYIGVTLPIVMVILGVKVSNSGYWISTGLGFPIFVIGQFYNLGFVAMLLAVFAATASTILYYLYDKLKPRRLKVDY